MLSRSNRWASALCASALAFLLPVSALHASPGHPQSFGGQWAVDAQVDGFATGDFLGASVAPAGDVDGDGAPDIAIGAPYSDQGGIYQAGAAYVLSGRGLFLIRSYSGLAEHDHFGVVSTAGDWDGDGVADLAVGAPDANPLGRINAGSVTVFSGATGDLLWHVDGTKPSNLLGSAVAGGVDVDGDGFDDVLVGVPGADPNGNPEAGSAHVYSGASGARILKLDGVAAGAAFGTAVAFIPDLDGDGVDDLLIGAPGDTPNGWRSAGSASVHSSATGALLLQAIGDSPGDRFGASVAFAGDVDANGIADFMAGAPDGENGVGHRDAGYVKVLAGTDGSLLRRLEGEDEYHRFGCSVSELGDVDRDGFDDFLVGAEGTSIGLSTLPSGAAYAFSGRTGLSLHRLETGVLGDRIGAALAGVGDLDGDGFPDAVVGAPGSDPGGRIEAGTASVLRFDPFLRVSSQTLSVSSGVPLELKLEFPASEGGKAYALLASATGTGPTAIAGLQVPLSADPLLSASLAGRLPQNVLGAHGSLNALGHASASIVPTPLTGQFIGRSVFVAAASCEAGGGIGRLSSAYQFITITP